MKENVSSNNFNTYNVDQRRIYNNPNGNKILYNSPDVNQNQKKYVCKNLNGEDADYKNLKDFLLHHDQEVKVILSKQNTPIKEKIEKTGKNSKSGELKSGFYKNQTAVNLPIINNIDKDLSRRSLNFKEIKQPSLDDADETCKYNIIIIFRY